MVLGRQADDLSVPWDRQISRRHASLTLSGESLRVGRVPGSGNPIFFKGAQNDSFEVAPGEHFVIGETTFTFSCDQAMATVDMPSPVGERTFTQQFLRQVRYRDADRRIEVLNRLPEIIASADDQDDLLSRMISTLMAGIPDATAVGIVCTNSVSPSEASDTTASSEGSHEVTPIEIRHWDQRGNTTAKFEASQRLILDAIARGQTVLHFWDAAEAPDDRSGGYTMDDRNDWAFVSPMVNANNAATDSVPHRISSGQAASKEPSPANATQWAVYVAGKNRASASISAVNVSPVGDSRDNGPSQPTGPAQGDHQTAPDLEGDIKFCELVAATLKNLLDLRQLQRRQSTLRRFFSPAVVREFATRDPDEALKPRPCEVSVLFCDLRGFSRTSERLADDLLQLLRHVGQPLGIMTRMVLEHGGVIGDFHGDAAMGFWGWPVHQPDHALLAARAALEIQQRLQTHNAATDYPFEMGIGIATGRAVAGRIGTDDQEKVTVFGPVVNLASRLEGITAQVGASILIDDATAVALQQSPNPPPTVPLGRLLPAGMKNPVLAHLLIERRLAEADSLESRMAAVNEAFQRFDEGDWNAAAKLLGSLDADDPTRRLLMSHIENHATPTPHSIIVMDSK